MTTQSLLGAAVLLAIGFGIGRFCKRFRSAPIPPVNPIPQAGPSAQKDDADGLAHFVKEWEIVINTQMHFNDLIIRFRTLAITAFVTLVGAGFALFKTGTMNITKEDFILILVLVGTLWLSSFTIDIFYYQKMLRGSVAQADKFDNNDFLSQKGHFGLTACISQHVSAGTSNFLIFLYYLLPLLALVFLGLKVK